MHAEQAYIFRHTLLRDAAYQLQLPTDRARLHALAFESIEQLHGGRPIESANPFNSLEEIDKALDIDEAAAELAEHAAMAALENDHASLNTARCFYLYRAASHAQRNFLNAKACALWLSLAELCSGVNRGSALCRAGLSALRDNRAKDAVCEINRSLEIFRQCGDSREEAIALSELAVAQHLSSQMFTAEQTYKDALVKLRESGNFKGEGKALSNLACLYENMGRHADAEQIFAEALRVHRQSGNRADEGSTLANLAALLRQTRRLDASLETYERALGLIREVRDRREEAKALTGLAGSYEVLGRTQEARVAAQKALSMAREIGDLRQASAALITMTSILRQENRLADAMTAALEALEIFQQSGDGYGEGIVTCSLALTLHDQGKWGEAEQMYLRAIAISERVGNRHSTSICWVNLARLYGSIERMGDADQAYSAAIELQRALQNSGFEGAFRCDYACWLLETSRKPIAAEQWNQGIALLQQTGDTRRLQLCVTRMKKALANLPEAERACFNLPGEERIAKGAG